MQPSFALAHALDWLRSTEVDRVDALDPTGSASGDAELLDLTNLTDRIGAHTGCPSHRNAQASERNGIVRFGTGESERVWHARGRRPVPRRIEKRHRLA
jgi:hypothetical protein